MKILFILLAFLVTSSNLLGQNVKSVGSLSFQKHIEKKPLKVTDFAVKGNQSLLQNNSSVHYKYANQDWHFIRCTAVDLAQLMNEGAVEQIYFTPSAPRLLNDTMRLTQNIDSIHAGYAPLDQSYKGENIVMGYVDTGIDFEHEDFLNEDGSTRVLRYWDQGLAIHPTRTPSKYGYGQVWTNTDIDNGICTSTDNHAHGSTVTGSGSGNGRAIHKHTGVAPKSDIIIIETSFSLDNWTLTVADAIDYVFAVADSLGKPAVVNTSVGSYLGSHDGTDPASQIVDSLLKEKPGRIVVAAAGNSGNWGNYHLRANVDADTSFCWLEVNLSSTFGSPAVFFDLWADTADFKNVKFAFGTDAETPNFEFRGRTEFFSIETLLNTTKEDSIMTLSGFKASPVSFSCEEINGVYHIEALLENPDSTDYLYRFMTTGSGSYDLWSGAAIGLSKIREDNLPNATFFPDVAHIHLPDSLISTVSSWTCLESVITVGNLANQLDYIDQTGSLYTFNHTPGMLSINSSKGPTRKNSIKPDISATGDGTLSACPSFLITSLMNSGGSALADGNKHVRNGGTSMASPVIAGIAALYLEKCNQATYDDFKTDLLATAHSDNFTGNVPNFAYGYGKINAYDLLNKTNYYPTLFGNTLICGDTAFISTVESNYAHYKWSTLDTSPTTSTLITENVYVTTRNDQGCRGHSDTLSVIRGTIPTDPTINVIGGGLVSTPAHAYQWILNDQEVLDATEQYFNPIESGFYSVKVTGPEGCYLISNKYDIDISTINELKNNEFIIFPNPFIDDFKIIKMIFMILS